MFYFDEFCGNKVLRSDFLKEINAFFTTRGFNLPKNLEGSIAYPEQIHGNNVETVDNRTFYPNSDGLIITRKDLFIRLKFADCTPLMFYNPKTKTGAISHAGWRGTASKIGVKTVEKMGGNPEDIIAIIGPAIGVCCYEVSEDVKEKLLSTVHDRTGLYDGNKVDLKLINARQLKEAGIKRIDICPYCTSCNNDLFYSYRKENGTTNRHFAFMQL